MRMTIVAAGLALFAGDAYAACSLTVAWEPYGKYTNRDADGNLYGIDVDLMRALGQRTGCIITFREMPFKRVLVELSHGTVDVSTSVNRTPDREAYARFSEPYYHQTVTLFVRKAEADTYSLRTLADAEAAKFRIGVVAGYFLGNAFAELRKRPGFAALVEEGPDYAANVRKLAENRIQGLLGDSEAVVMEAARQAGFADAITPYPMAMERPGVHLMFSRKSVPQSVVDAFDAALAAMKKDGSLQAIMSRYES